MRQVRLGRTGLQVSAVGFGGIPIQRISDQEAIRTVRAALDAGVTFIDTAAGYSDSQKKIGMAIEGRRDGLVIATKSGQKTADGIRADIDRARSEMGVDCIDIYQLHGVSRPQAWEQIKSDGGALEALLDARERGHIAHIGFTSHSLDLALSMAADPVFETIQFPFNLVTSEPAEKLIPLARERDLGFIVMKPLCGGQFRDATLAFKFLNAFPDLVAIPGIETPEEIREIVALVEEGHTLSGEDKKRADEVVAELGRQFCRRCGYCEPCPHGVPIQTAMVWGSFLARMSPERVKSGFAPRLAEQGANCIECGVCEQKCPYELPIMATVKKNTAAAREMIES